MFAIAAVAENGVIGKEGKMPWHLPGDFRWFKYRTQGGVLLMGRKTYESIGRPLPGRTTCVLTHHQDWQPPGSPAHVHVCPDWHDLPADETLQVWVCGGAEVYTKLLPECRRFYRTVVKSQPEGDTFFPALPKSFHFDSLIHENAEFRVERWLNLDREIKVDPEPWPF